MNELVPNLHLEIIPLLKKAKEFRVAVALMNEYVLDIFEETLPADCEKRYLVGINLPTHPAVLQRLLTLQQTSPNFKARIYKAKENYHPKVYIIRDKTDESYSTFLGSANATRGGWYSNVEMNSLHRGEKGAALIPWFDDLFKKGIDFDESFIERYTKAFNRNKFLERTMRSNVEEILDENRFPPPNVNAITDEQFFRVTDFEAYAPPTHAVHDAPTVAGRNRVKDRLLELDELIYPYFNENGIAELFRHPIDQFRTARTVRPMRGNIRDAIWLHYGKSEQELKLYAGEGASSFTNHIRIQVILRHTETTAFIGTWIYIGKGGGSIKDREFIQSRLDSPGFLTVLKEFLQHLGNSYYLDIGGHDIKISQIQSEKSLKAFLLYDKKKEFKTDFKIGRNYKVDHPDLRQDKIAETTLLEFAKLYRIYQIFRHRMPEIKTPSECTSSELKAFRELVLEGGQLSVSENKLKENIANCLYLAFQYRGSELAGISAIKQHTLQHVKEKPLTTYKINNVPDDHVPLLELGYSVTKSEYRGTGINSVLNDMLLTKIEGRKVYGTTGVHSMKRYLKKRGFEIKGKPHDGKKSQNIEYFEKIA
jgi:HKD family nuclease